MDFIKKLGKSLIIGTVVGILVSFLTSKFVPDLIDRLEHQSYYMRYIWKYFDLAEDESESSQQDETGIYIIDIDDRSMLKLGNYSNWPRSHHADMLNSISENYPAAVLFDINFQMPQDSINQAMMNKILMRSHKNNPQSTLTENTVSSILSKIDYDKQFIDATSKAGNVYHAVRLASQRDFSDVGLSQIQYRSTLQWHNSLNPKSTITLPENVTEKINTEKTIIDGIFPPLAKAAKAIGHINMNPNSDGVIREVDLVYALKKQKAVYLPISMRSVISLFGTPDEEIVFKSGRYIDIGKPFKIFNDSDNTLSYSYPNITTAQIKAIIQNSKKILSLKPGEILIVSPLLTIFKDDDGNGYVSSYFGDLPFEVSRTIMAENIEEIINLKANETIVLEQDIEISKTSDIEWTITAPFGDEEWYIDNEKILELLPYIDKDAFNSLESNCSKLIFHNFEVKNKKGKLLSSIPIFRENTLKELCKLSWNEIENMEPDTRRDFGDNTRIPLTPTNKFIVTYFGNRGDPFKYWPYYDIKENRIQGHLDGKIYIVGSTVSGLFDIVSVPVSNSYPGVEVHASLINSFITNTFVTRLEPWQDFLILLFVGIIIGIIGYLIKPLLGIILSFSFVIIYFLVAMTLFGSDNLWIEIVRPILTIVLTYTVVMAYRYITEEKDRKFLQSTFKQYLSPELIDAMYKTKQMPKLGGEEGIRTAYFTDIQAFSTFSEKLGSPTRLVELLNEYLTAMTDSLLAHYGTLDKYEGDAIIAFYGAPMHMEDHAQQACNTAIDMQKRLGDLRKKWSGEGDKWPQIVHDMRMRIGINTGAITTGNMGSATRMNYTMMGDAVNLAARLESAAKQYGIYTMISHMTYDIIKDDFEVRLIDKITVVGKTEPVVVYELLDKKGKLDSQTSKLVDIYNRGLDLFYSQQWDQAIETLTESENLEPNKKFSSGGITPSKKIISYCEMFKENPPEKDWDGVMKLTSK